jgi:cell division protein FtsB
MSALRQLSTSHPIGRRQPIAGQPRAIPPVDRRLRKNPLKRQQQQLRQSRFLAMETGLKLAVNCLVSGVAIATLCHILPHRSAEQEKLAELQHEVKKTEVRVGRLKGEFNRAFDPSQVRSIAQEQTNLADPSRRAIKLQEDRSESAAQLPE